MTTEEIQKLIEQLSALLGTPIKLEEIQAQAAQNGASISEILLKLEAVQSSINQHNATAQDGIAKIISMLGEPGGGTGGGEPGGGDPGGGGGTPVNQKPEVTIIKPAAGQSLTSGSTFVAEALATDADGSIERVEFYLNGNKPENLVKTERQAPYEAPLSVGEGVNTLLVIAYDNEGEASAGQEIIFTGKAVATGEPTGGLFDQVQRVYIGFDGTNNDWDDVAAIVMTALMVAAKKAQGKVLFSVGNNITEVHQPDQVEAINASVEFARSLGIKVLKWYEDENGTRDQIAQFLSSGQPTVCLEGGPMEAAYRVMEVLDPSYRGKITFVSHSAWNNNRANGNARDWSDLQNGFPECAFIKIDDQNTGFRRDELEQWDDPSQPAILYEAAQLFNNALPGGAGKDRDVSDSGMWWWLMTGDENARVREAMDFVEANLPTKMPGATNPGEVIKEVEPGIVAIQAEELMLPAGTDWKVEEGIHNASGKYLVWRGEDHFNDVPAGLKINIPFEVSRPGIYQIQLRNVGLSADKSQANDTWFRGNDLLLFALKDGGERIFPVGNAHGITEPVNQKNDGIDGFLKIYSNQSFDASDLEPWTMQSSAIDSDPHQVFLEIPLPGVYVLEMAPRSAGHAIDMIFLREISLAPSAIDQYIQTGGSGGVVIDPVDPKPQWVEEDLLEWVTGADYQQYFGWKAADLPLGVVSEKTLRELYNAADAFVGSKWEMEIEDVPELGGDRYLRISHRQGFGGGWYERFSVPKSSDYPPASIIGSRLTLAYLEHNETGNEEIDKRTWRNPKHCKGSGFQTDHAPLACDKPGGGNPVQEEGNAELTTVSIYGPQMPQNGLTAKGDVAGPFAPGGFTQWKPGSNFSDPEFNRLNQLFAMGLYSAGVVDYKCQSQVWPLIPGTNHRYMLPPRRDIESVVLLRPNTFSPVRTGPNGEVLEVKDNKDGQILWLLKDGVTNGGDYWIAANMTGLTITRGKPMVIRKHGFGLYYNSGDALPFAAGLYLKGHRTVYL